MEVKVRTLLSGASSYIQNRLRGPQRGTERFYERVTTEE
jgi:hypothetical protein